MLNFNSINDHPSVYMWKVCEDERFLAGDPIEIPLAFIAENIEHHGLYGDRKVEGYRLSAYTEHLLTIEVFSGKKRQNKRIYIKIPHSRTGVALNGLKYDGNRFILVEEGQPFFDDVRFRQKA